ncbi:MAG: hypothetical protein ABW123_19225, partial [Cystobacter sp.]
MTKHDDQIDPLVNSERTSENEENHETEQAVDQYHDVEKSLDAMSDMHRAMDPLGGVQKSLDAISDMHRAMNPFRSVQKSLDAISDMHRAMDPFRGIQKRLDAMHDMHRAMDPFRGIQKSLESMHDRHQAALASYSDIIESAESRAFSSIKIAFQSPAISKQFNLIKSTARSIAERHAFGHIASTIAAVGLAGRFDIPTIDAAVTAAELLDSEKTDPETLNKIRENPVLIDTVVDIQTFVNESKDASNQVVQQALAKAVEAILLRIETRLSAATSNPERISIFNWLGFILAVLSFLSSLTQNYQSYLAYDLSKKSAGVDQAV